MKPQKRSHSRSNNDNYDGGGGGGDDGGSASGDAGGGGGGGGCGESYSTVKITGLVRLKRLRNF